MTRVNLPLSRNLAIAIYSNHRLDNAWNGRWLRRLPDLTLVFADEYEERLKEYEGRREVEAKEAGESR